MFQDISVAPFEITVGQLRELSQNSQISIIDVRSPSEFEDSTIPNSINIPIFDDEERKIIGTLYKQESAELATDKGLEIFSRKLPELYRQYEQLPNDKVVFCWRGGMRSKATATFLSLMGVKCYRLKGGFRAYRSWVVEQLESFELKPKCVVVNGLTGSGKTKILQALSEESYPVLDLEGMAKHRGSVFGHIGLKPNNQKTFETQLVNTLIQHNESPYVLMEAESKRVGKVSVPDFLMKAKEQGTVIFLDMPPEERVRNIIDEYKPEQNQEDFIDSFLRIKSKIHTPVAADIERYLRESKFAEAFSLLLEYHYDPRYEYATDKYPGDFIVLKVKNIKEGVAAVKEELKKIACR